MAVSQLVWDMDGTLLDSASAVPAAFVAAVRRLGGPGLSAADVIAGYSRGPSEAVLAYLLGRELSAGEPEVYYAELAGLRIEPYPGITAVLGALRAAGQPVAVFTGASRRAAEMLLAAAGLHYDVLVGGDEVSRPKPAPDGLLLIADRLGVPAAALAYIGDAAADLGAAAAAGSLGAAAAWGHQYDRHAPADQVLAAPADALALIGQLAGL